jgi:hypothetical protein
MMICNHFKKTYEIENDFEYDVVIRCRFDLIWNPINVFSVPKNIYKHRHSLYIANMWYHDDNINPFVFDSFFFGSSQTMDIVCNIYNESTFYAMHNMYYGPEDILYTYCKNKNIQFLTLSNQYQYLTVRYDAIGLHHINDFKKIQHINNSFFQNGK